MKTEEEIQTNEMAVVRSQPAAPITLAPPPLNEAQLLEQVNLIQRVMRSVMRQGEHYGCIPGCGDKPSLFKSGAEKLGLVFRLTPRYSINKTDLAGGHREYEVICTLSNGGQGVGSCSTLEGKYRYRTGPKIFTDQPVPKEYWNHRADRQKAQQILGGEGMTVGKNEMGAWVICHAGERIEHDNPADYYNTALKMAKKRAMVDAILTNTAASDCFTQDLEDMDEVVGGEEAATSPAQTSRKSGPLQNQSKGTAKAATGQDMPRVKGWRDITVTFGKNKGVRLGDLPVKSLQWYHHEWQPKPNRDGRLWPEDLQMKEALNQAAAEFGWSETGAAEQGVARQQEASFVTEADDNVPYPGEEIVP